MKVWYEKKGEYLDVLFDWQSGYFRETENVAVLGKVYSDGNVLRFSFLKVSSMGERSTLSVSLMKRTS